MDTSQISPNTLNGIGTALLFGGFFAAILLFIYHRKFPASRNALDQAITGRSWSNAQTGLLLAAFAGLFILVSAINSVVSFAGPPSRQLFAVFLFASMQLLALIWLGRRRGTTWAHDFGMGLVQLKVLPLVPAIYLAVLPGIGIATLLYQGALRHVFGMEPSLQEAAQLIAQSNSWIATGYMLLAIVAAPLYEELLFRGVLFPFLAKRIGLYPGILAVSAIFAAIHFHIASITPLFLLSIVLCLAYWRTGSLWTSIGIHAVFNAVGTLALRLTN